MKKTSMVLLVIFIILAGVSCRGTAGSDSDEIPEMPQSATASPAGSADDIPESSAGDKNVIMLKGTIGEFPVHMRLYISDGVVTGSYYYDTVGLELTLEGTTEADRMIAMNEYDEKGELTGKFGGWYTRGIRMTGSWTNPKTQETLDFNLNIIGGIPANAVWAGEWQRMDTGRFDSATLLIFNETKSGFKFQMDAYSGAHMGFIDGEAVIDGKTARFMDKESDAELIFTLKGELVEVVSGGDIGSYAGMGVGFDGTYTKKALPKETLLTQGYVFSKEQDDAFRAMTGVSYDLFLNTAHLGYEAEDLDALGAEVYRWRVRGLAGSNESIVMFLPGGGLCAAVLDTATDTVRVFANTEEIGSTPQTILSWIADLQEALGRTADMPVEFRNTDKN